MSALPRGWARVALGDVADIRLGKMLDGARTTGTPRLYLRNVNVRWDSVDTTDLLTMPFKDEELERYGIRPGDLLVCEGGEPGRSAIWTHGHTDLKYQKALHRVRLAEGVAGRWVMFSLMRDASTGQLSRRFTGSTIAHLPREKLVDYEVTIPPAAEQERIIEALDSHLSRLDAAVASLARAQRKLKAYRASVLKAAVEGRLVPTEAELARKEGSSYEPADVLLERILNARRRRWEESELAKMNAGGKTPQDDRWKANYEEPARLRTNDLPRLAEGWSWTTLDAFLAGIDAGKNFSCDERPPNAEEIGVVKISAVTWGTFDENESKTCTRNELANLNHLIRPGDFLFSRANTLELVGACVIVGQFRRTLLLSDKILRLRFLGGTERWLMWVLRSYWGRREIESLASGNQLSMRNLSQANLRRLRIPVPPTAEIDRIVEQLDLLLSVADESTTALTKNSNRVRRLRQTVLKSAFEGKLVEQDPSDEPADVLLACIRAERAVAAPPTPKTKRARTLKAAS